jgi:hypothetical protein
MTLFDRRTEDMHPLLRSVPTGIAAIIIGAAETSFFVDSVQLKIERNVQMNGVHKE